jgi:hypothetical protein
MKQIIHSFIYTRNNFFYLLALCIPIILLSGALFSIVILPFLNGYHVEDIVIIFDKNLTSIRILSYANMIFSIIFIGALFAGFESINSRSNKSTLSLYKDGLMKFFILLGAYFLYETAIFAGFMVLILPSFYLMARFGLYPCFIMFENEGVIKSLGRSWEMTDEYGGKLFVITLFFMFTTYIAVSIIIYFIPISNFQMFLIALAIYIIKIPLMYVYYSLYKSLSN